MEIKHMYDLGYIPGLAYREFINKIKLEFSNEFIEWNHNHSVVALHALGFKDIPSEVSLEIKHMYDLGLTFLVLHTENLSTK